MKLVLMVIGGIVGALVFANIVAATFIWPPATTTTATRNTATNNTAPNNTLTNDATRQGQDPWMANEKYNAPHRDHTRKGALATLDQPWASYCTADGHELLIATINNYYWQRHSQAWSYGKTYGEVARNFSIKTWTTADDSRIERLIGETYGRGFFALSQLQPHAREALGKQVKGMHVSAKPCAS